MEANDDIIIKTPDGREHRYRVEDAFVVDEDDLWVLSRTEEKSLTLITCYPFDAVTPGGRGRYVVRAVSADLMRGASTIAPR